MIITILTDNEKSWFIPYAIKLKNELIQLGHNVDFVTDKNHIIKRGDVCFLLSCIRIIEKEYLELNKNNIVVHASDLPKGKGFSPLKWQILEGKNEIVLTLFEVVEKVDSGPYYLKETIYFEGHELLDEMREIMVEKIISMCKTFLNNYKNLKPIPQSGEETFYRRRNKKDDEIDPDKTIAEQFNHFRIADNDMFPIYFFYKGHKYILKIYKEK